MFAALQSRFIPDPGMALGLQINAGAHAPLLCVKNVFAVASGDLGLPGKME